MSALSCPTCAARRTLCCGFDGGGANLKPLAADLYLMLVALAFIGGRNRVSGARISERNIVVLVLVVVIAGGENFGGGLFDEGGMLSRNWLGGILVLYCTRCY